MNRALKRRLARAKPSGNRHDHARIPKIILQDRDFSQIDLLMLKLQKGEVETIDGHIVMTTMEGETYRVIPAMEGWLEYWRTLAGKAGIDYDDGALLRLKNRLENGMPLTQEAIAQAREVVDLQRRMFFSIPASIISSLATTQQIKMYIEPTTTQGETA